MIVKNVEKKENNGLSLTIEISKDEFAEAVNGAFLKNRKSIAVPGFRKGKAPRMVIEGMYGENVFYDDAIEDIAPKAYEFAIETEKLNTVGRPSVANVDINDEKILTLTIEAALYPEVTLGQYKNLEVAKEEINITDETVVAYLDDMRKRNGRKTIVERAAQNGDIVLIDYDGYMDGERFNGGKAEGQELELGSNTFVPGFEEQVVGMNVGDEKEINITFPETYHADLAGKAVVFKVTVHEVSENILPELDDEFAKDVSEFDTLADYKVAINEELLKKRTQNVEEEFSFNVTEAAIANMTCEIPETMVDDRLEMMINDYRRNLMGQGMQLEEYIRMMGMDPSTFQSMLRPQALKQVQTDLMLAAVVEAEKIEVTAEEIDEACKGIAESYGMTVEDIKKAVPQDSIEHDMKMKKAADLLLETAVPTAPVAKDETADKT
ncbi:MAG: trigger factor, partial [Oscillospiraceae bacterium]